MEFACHSFVNVVFLHLSSTVKPCDKCPAKATIRVNTGMDKAGCFCYTGSGKPVAIGG